MKHIQKFCCYCLAFMFVLSFFLSNPAIAAVAEEPQRVESGPTWGQCFNETGRKVGFYGLKVPDRNYDNFLYSFASGSQTAQGWDCDGLWIPNDVKVVALAPSCAGQSWTGPAAYKISDFTELKVRSGPGQIETNICPIEVYRPGNVNWWIPDQPWNWIQSF